MRDTFANRVQILHESWAERRQVAKLAGTHDFDSQFRLVATLHEWATEACQDISEVYEERLAVSLSPLPDAEDIPPAFSITIGDRHSVTFSLLERRRMNGSRWHVSVSVASTGPGGSIAHAGPERRNGHWSRSRVEDVLLSLLGAYERAQGDGEEPPSLLRPLEPGAGAGVAF